MNRISKQQLFDRWDSLSTVLREATTSETNSDIVWKAGETQHLPKEKLSAVSRLVGYVLMGFIHPEDLARELHENLGIDIRIATSIAEPINKKVFQPLHNELEKIYAPAIEEGGQADVARPVMVDSISSHPSQGFPLRQGSEGQVGGQATSPLEKLAKFEKSTSRAPSSSPFPPTQSSMPTPAKTSVSAMSPMQKDSPQAPFILHQESTSQPLAPSDNKQSFKVGLSGEQFGKMEQKWVAPPKPAQIETSAIQKPVAPKTDARVVHYSEMRTPMPPVHSSTDLAVKKQPDAPTVNKTEVPKPPTRKTPQPVVSQSNPPPPNIAFSPIVIKPPMVRRGSPQEKMLMGKPEEKELPEPHKI